MSQPAKVYNARKKYISPELKSMLQSIQWLMRCNCLMETFQPHPAYVALELCLMGVNRLDQRVGRVLSSRALVAMCNYCCGLAVASHCLLVGIISIGWMLAKDVLYRASAKPGWRIDYLGGNRIYSCPTLVEATDWWPSKYRCYRYLRHTFWYHLLSCSAATSIVGCSGGSWGAKNNSTTSEREF